MERTLKIFATVLIAALIFSLAVPVLAEESYAEVVGTVVEIQKYGNLVLDIKPKVLYDAGYEVGDILKVTVGGQELEIPFGTSYSDVDTGNLIVRDDRGNDLLLVAINMGNFASTYNVNVGDTVTFSMLEKEGYLAEYLLRQLSRSDVRSDYATDSIFANFRSITTTGIKPGLIYRSSSPVNNEIGRAAYADRLAKAVGINTVINLADSDEKIKSYFAEEGFSSDYYKSLYDSGKVIALDMGVDIAGEDFGQKLAEGLRFLVKNDGPYLIHCTEGKDRAGFVSAVLEALMGATYDEVIADYMTTYENYYGVEKGSEQYKAIAESNIVASLTTVVCQYEKGTDISKVNLAEAAEKYLRGIGLTSSEIKALKQKLSAQPVLKSPSVVTTVKEIEKYGHALTDMLIEDFYNLGFKAGDMVTVVFDNGFVLEAPFLDGYYVEKGQPLVRAYPGHTNIGICINYGKLNEIAKVEVGDKAIIMLTGPEEYRVQYEIRKLERTNNREDYNSDEEFANFRNITVGKIAKGVLYRSSSPINNELGRAAYADKLMEKAKVKTVVNLADSVENISNYMDQEDFASPYYAELYNSNQVIALNMALAYESKEFRESVIKGLTFMADNDGPYLFHCTEGKDRAGFFAALIEALMGASRDEIVEDYMQSYINFFGVEKDTEKYNVISQDILGMLKFIAGTEDLANVDLAKAAENYLLKGGMEIEKINALKVKLSKAAGSEEVATGESKADEAKTAEKYIEKETKAVKTYLVVKGDCLWKIAEKELGAGRRYIEIYNLNKDKIKDPNKIYVGQKLILP